MPLTQIDPVAALVVIDMQKGIVALPTAHPAGEVAARIATLARAFRERALPASGDDLDKIVGDVAFRFARDGDDFQDMSGDADLGGPPKPGEVVYADAAKVLCRRWNWRQDGRSTITPQTRRALVVLQANGFGDVAAAAEDLAALLGRFCGGQCQIAVADANRPVVAVG